MIERPIAQSSRTKRPSRRWLGIGGGVTGAVVATCGILLAANWPFNEALVIEHLQNASLSAVGAQHFQRTFFPHPGCVLENVEYKRRPGSRHPLITIRRLTVEGTWTALFSLQRYVKEMRAEGLSIYIPSPVPRALQGIVTQKPEATVGEVVADGAVIQVEPKNGSSGPLLYQFPRLTLRNAAKSKKIHFEIALKNPNPPDDIQAAGDFGPWNANDSGATPVAGTFLFTHANLGYYNGLAGTLSSKGKFDGTLEHIETAGIVRVPNFEVTASRHKVALEADYQAVVDAMHGNVDLPSVTVKMLGTTLWVKGAVAGAPGEAGKTATLECVSRSARIEDLFRLVTASDPAPLNGPVMFRAHVVLPPDGRAFLRKLMLSGDFGVNGADFISPSTRRDIDLLSARARGNEPKGSENPEHVAADLNGTVSLREGLATFSKLDLRVPGARARLEGNFNVLNEKIQLHGTLATEASLSKDAGGGIKSFLLKPLNPLFKKKRAGAVIPIGISGTYSQPSYGFSLTKK